MRRLPPPPLVIIAIALASQVPAWRAVLPLVPAVSTRPSPSSDVLLGGLGIIDGVDRIDALAATMPVTPGVVVAHGTTAAWASAYFVASMRLWPRPVSLVVCEPRPTVEQFRVPHDVPAWHWRIDLRAGGPDSVTGAAATPPRRPEDLCRS